MHRQPAYDRNQFLQANFRFLVSDAADLRRHAVDADLMLDWDDVVEVSSITCIQCESYSLHRCMAQSMACS